MENANIPAMAVALLGVDQFLEQRPVLCTSVSQHTPPREESSWRFRDSLEPNTLRKQERQYNMRLF